ncbi:VVA0879 family protein [Paenactinomyces guangxiensis]|uniref:Uncharacterized protein n=1 Tax=Paenactinomyces guangxiensis TaxID=1490290 RepID=A0A7W2A9H0_9BACL|nr:VVA0879 family protein [Paenactinomyces guangxiensis]MBA4495244.1 hypothetical protein [Paenactinomyces guangxiensis]MBH8592328.1 hypothetical protein [Paenactinomyces guangxiensis]
MRNLKTLLKSAIANPINKSEKEKVLMVVQTQNDWLKEMTERYSDLYLVSFECPNCGHVQTIADFNNLKIYPGRAYKDCIGKYVKDKGCNWSIDNNNPKTTKMLSKCRIVITEDGKEYRVFDFAG